MKKIFFCWQATTPGNKSYISSCLKDAIGDFPDYEYDEATRGKRGAVDINESILEKIDEASLFVADISKILEEIAPNNKLINSNVALEVGYALAKMPRENWALIFNKDSGDADKLPFDIRNLRRAEFKFSTQNKPILTEMFRDMIRDHSIQPPINVNEPKIQAALRAYNTNGAMDIDFKNDEADAFILHSFEFGSKEIFSDVTLSPNTVTLYSIGSGLPSSPYDKKYKYLSFVVSDRNATYRVKQRINLECIEGSRYQLMGFDVRASSAQIIKTWRKIEFEEISASFDGKAYIVTDFDTENSFELRISGTCWTILGSIYETDNENIARRFAYALNNKYEGMHTDVVTIYSSDIIDGDLNSTIESIV